LQRLISLCNYRGYGLYMGHILSLFTYLLLPFPVGYPSYYPAGTRVINYPDTAALVISRALILTCWSPILVSAKFIFTSCMSLMIKTDITQFYKMKYSECKVIGN